MAKTKVFINIFYVPSCSHGILILLVALNMLWKMVQMKIKEACLLLVYATGLVSAFLKIISSCFSTKIERGLFWTMTARCGLRPKNKKFSSNKQGRQGKYTLRQQATNNEDLLGEKGASIPSLTSTRGAKCVDGECEFPKSLALKVHPREQLGENRYRDADDWLRRADHCSVDRRWPTSAYKPFVVLSMIQTQDYYILLIVLILNSL